MKAIIIQNIQNDFLDIGAKPLGLTNQLIEKVQSVIPKSDIVILVKKVYPAEYPGFAANHPWRKPGQEIELDGKSYQLEVMHCVEGSFGAEVPLDFSGAKTIYTIENNGDNGDQLMEQIQNIVQTHQVSEIEVLGPENKKRSKN